MSEINYHLQDLPQLPTPKERAQEEILGSALWLASVAASKLYDKRRNIPEIYRRIKELFIKLDNYQRDHLTEIDPPLKKKTKKVTIEETTEETKESGLLSPIDNSWLATQAYKASAGIE